MQHPLVSLLLILTTCGVLGACGTSEIPTVSVAKQWADTIENYSLQPIYPLREDVRVGDIKLTIDPSTAAPNQLPFRDIGFLDLNAEMEAYYQRRPSYPADNNLSIPADGSRPWVQPVANGSLFQSNGADTKRLRMMALPAIKVATVFQGSLSGQGLLGAIGIGGAASASKGKLFDISLAGLEELRAPDDFTIFQGFSEYCAKESVSGRLHGENIQRSLNIMTAEGTTSDKSNPQIAILNRVLYTRTIDFTFRTEEGYSADVSAVIAGLSELAKFSNALGSSQASSPSVPESESSAGAEAKEIADFVAALRAKVTGTNSPGVALSAVYVDARGITLRDIYERPLAFATQAVTFSYNAEDVCRSNTAAPGEDRVYGVPPFLQ